MKTVCIVGGGIAGLSAAWRLQQIRPDVQVTLLEASERVGGKLRTERICAPEGDYVCEAGAESFVRRTPDLWRMVCELGLDGAADAAHDAVGMHLVKNGVTHPVPTSPAAFLKTPLLSLRGKLRMMSEPFRAARCDGADESMAKFVTRRFGREALDELLGPIFGGIYNADPEVQSVLAVLPSLHEAERVHGSVVRGMLRKSARDASSALPASPTPRGAFAFSGGVDVFVDALRARLTCDVRTNAPVLGLRAGERITARLRDEEMTVDAVILATSASVAAKLTAEISADASERLAQIRQQPIGTVVLAWRTADVPLDRCMRGVVIPRRERRRIDAVLFASHKRPSCAPAGYTLLRVFFGGADASMPALAESPLLQAIRDELRDLFGITAPPLHAHLNCWQDGFVNATVGHHRRVEKIAKLLPSAIRRTGASYHGVGVADCVREAQQCVDQWIASDAF